MTDLTVPDRGSTTARDVLSRAIGRLLRELRPTLRTHAASAPDDAAAMDRAVASLLRDEVGPLAAILRRPHAAVLLRTLRATPPGSGDALLSSLLATIAFDLAHLGALARAVTLRRAPQRVVSLVARVAAHLPPAPVTFENERPPASAIEHPFHPIEGDAVLALADENPLAMVEAHPDKRGNAIDLGGRAPGDWVAALRDALAIVAAHAPDLRDEMRPFVQQVVPVGFFEDRHLSASYRESIGTLYLSLHPNPMTMLEAIVHETQHNKLNALFEVDDVLENDPGETFASPVRPDARPLAGVLLAVHAFVPVAVIYERMISAGDTRATAARLHEIVAKNHAGTRVLLDNARPTAAGRALLDELARWDAHFSAR